MVQCYNTDCPNESTKSCAACSIASYCSTTCQKIHWKAHHKRKCLRILPTEILPISEVLQILNSLSIQLQKNVTAGESDEDQILSLKHLLSFAEFQLFDRQDGYDIDDFTASALAVQYTNLGQYY